ncbi:phosphotyrosine protein phosphatase [Marinithermofilum abyssi]|uniref:protein-tyrosine-phosphatase n=1 Tax=Marinithermofilum abyssi TaxID=1571185 RepID=A0A8J2YD72_9BACL|nr:low molecular weight protein-tyrosine-phosphatase [Marinithermofilum abyssi]GGE23142.1 phosphotyrosine protein phosphatase [Marinithermofilum abyssi]
MVSVLFVCLGNICRSPMAEAVLRHKLRRQGLGEKVHVDSAGTGDWHVGAPPHHGTRAILARQGISYEGIKARQVKKEDLTRFDYIVVMEDRNMASIEQLAGHTDNRFYRLTDFIGDPNYTKVPDPYFTGDFEETYRLVEAGCEGLIRTIRAREEI